MRTKCIARASEIEVNRMISVCKSHSHPGYNIFSMLKVEVQFVEGGSAIWSEGQIKVCITGV